MISLYPLRRLYVPLVLLAIAAVSRSHISELAPAYQNVIEWLPYVTLGIALALAAFFNRSRVFTAALGLLALYIVIRLQLETPLGNPRAFLIYSLAGIALPIGLAIVLFGLGLTARDGVLLAAGMAMSSMVVWFALISLT